MLNDSSKRKVMDHIATATIVVNEMHCGNTEYIPYIMRSLHDCKIFQQYGGPSLLTHH